MELTVRARRTGDDPRLAELYNADDGESLPISTELLRAEIERAAHGVRGELWVAELDGVVAGYLRASHAWWTGSDAVFWGEIHVGDSFRRRGTGTVLLEAAILRLRERDARRMVGWVPANATAAQRFAHRHGFRHTGGEIDGYRLDIAHATPYRLEAAPRLGAGEVRVVSLAELGEDDGSLRAVQRLEAEIHGNRVDDEELARRFADWRGAALHGPGRSAETYWVALLGGRPAGMTFLRRLTPFAAENDFTGVVPAARGRGIATLLKVTAIQWARESGVRSFYTSHEVSNAPMIAINERLGYRRGERRVEVARDL